MSPANNAPKHKKTPRQRPDQLSCYPEVAELVRRYKGLSGLDIQEIVKQAMEAYGLRKKIETTLREQMEEMKRHRG